MELPLVYKSEEINNSLLPYKKELGLYFDDFATIANGKIFGIGNFSDVVRATIDSPSVSSLSRFYNEVNPESINKIYRRGILEMVIANPSRYILALDDTIVEKTGKCIWGCYWWFDHCKNATVYGQKILYLGIIDTYTDQFVPLCWEVLHRDLDGSDNGSEHETGIDVAKKLLKRLLRLGFPKLPIVFDSWFCSSEFMEYLDEKNISFVSEIKNNRKVTKIRNQIVEISIKDLLRDSPRSKIMYNEKTKWASSSIVNLKGCLIKLKTVLVANNKGLKHDAFAYYVSNRTNWDAAKIWRLSRKRWAIEVQFRELKQLFTLCEAPVRSKQAVEIHLSMSAIALSVIRCQQLAIPDASKNQHARPVPALAIVQRIKIEALSSCISNLAYGEQSILRLKVKKKLQLKNYRKKPLVGKLEIKYEKAI